MLCGWVNWSVLYIKGGCLLLLHLLLHVACQAVCSGRDNWLCRYITSEFGVQAYVNHYAALSVNSITMRCLHADAVIMIRDMSMRLNHHPAKP